MGERSEKSSQKSEAEEWGGLHKEEEENVLDMHLGKGIEQILGYGGVGGWGGGASVRIKICISGPGTKSRGYFH